jgi:nitrite reductase/ring-hydroxylating ferredoxin subunit
VLSASGWLGGHLSYAQGVGVDTTVFENLPTEWTDALAESELPADGAVTSVELGGIPILVTRRGSRIVAMADRCTHRGGPLHEGEVRADCVVCPWHGSAFSLDDGEVRSGPATRPQPLLDARVQDGRVQVRRAEERTLRSNPVGN